MENRVSQNLLFLSFTLSSITLLALSTIPVALYSLPRCSIASWNHLILQQLGLLLSIHSVTSSEGQMKAKKKWSIFFSLFLFLQDLDWSRPTTTTTTTTKGYFHVIIARVSLLWWWCNCCSINMNGKHHLLLIYLFIYIELLYTSQTRILFSYSEKPVWTFLSTW